jgi:hypothetical protein
MALVFASMIGGISISPAFGYDHGRREWRHDRHWHGRYEYGRPGYYAPGYYPPPVYAPPPVVYPPYPYASPGINFVFPLHIR